VVGYNVQVAVDTEHHLIITHEVTNVGSDRAKLARMAEETKATLEATNLDVIADRGYFSSGQILACDKAGITVTLPKPMTSNAKAEGRFGKQDFRYMPRRMLTFVLPERSSTTTIRTRRMDWSYAVIGPLPVRDVPSSIAAPPPKSDGSRDGNTNTSWKPFNAGSTSIRRRCASGARRSSIPSARSKLGWELRTS
jgi:hypothetical protein